MKANSSEGKPLGADNRPIRVHRKVIHLENKPANDRLGGGEVTDEKLFMESSGFGELKNSWHQQILLQSELAPENHGRQQSKTFFAKRNDSQNKSNGGNRDSSTHSGKLGLQNRSAQFWS